MNILITGGCGFLGQNLVRDLLEAFVDLHIKVLDLQIGSFGVYDFRGHDRVTTVVGVDICDYEAVHREFQGADIVIHLAGVVSFSLKDKELLERVNVKGTECVVRAVNKCKIKQLIHISSVAALGYRFQSDVPIDENFQFNWKIAEKKKKYYMVTKRIADEHVLRDTESDVLVFYPGLMAGPGDGLNSPKLINSIKNKKIPFNMPGGTNIVDVRDVSRGIVLSIKKGVSHGTYLLSGTNIPFKEINATVAGLFGVAPPRYSLPHFVCPVAYSLFYFVERFINKNIGITAENVDSSKEFRYFDNRKAEKDLAWQPQISFTQTVTDTIKWMDEHDLLV